MSVVRQLGLVIVSTTLFACIASRPTRVDDAQRPRECTPSFEVKVVDARARPIADAVVQTRAANFAGRGIASPEAVTDAAGVAHVCDAAAELEAELASARAAAVAPTTTCCGFGGSMDGPQPWSTVGFHAEASARSAKGTGAIGYAETDVHGNVHRAPSAVVKVTGRSQ